MKTTGKLKEDIEKAGNREQAKEIIKDSGKKLSDDELEQVSGGINISQEIFDEDETLPKTRCS